MKTKLQFIALASLAVMGAGCLAVTTGVTANQNTQLSLNAETIDDTVGYVRLWIGSNETNPLNLAGGIPEIVISPTENEEDGAIYTNCHEYLNNAEGRRAYWYFDIPAEGIVGKYISIRRIDSATGNVWNRSSFSKITEQNVNQVAYLNYYMNGLDFGAIGSVDAKLASWALEGLQTCSSSDINGYNAFQKIANTFIKNEDGSWKTQGSIGGNIINDYASIDDYAGGNRTVEVDAWAKVQILEEMSGYYL